MKGITNCQSGGGGGTIYVHTLSLQESSSTANTKRCIATIYTLDATPFTNSSLKSWLETNGFDTHDNHKLYPVNGFYRESASSYPLVYGMYAKSGRLYVFYGSGSTTGIDWIIQTETIETL